MNRACTASYNAAKKGISLLCWFKVPKDVNSDRKNVLYVTCGRVLYVLLVIFLIGWWVFSNKDYYEISLATESQIVMDQYGYFETNFTREQFDPEANVTSGQLAAYNRFWVPNDYIRQDNDENVFDIYTNFGITNVSKGVCPEDPQFDNVVCNPKNYSQTCKLNKQSANGIQTGNCVQTALPLKHISPERRYICEVKAWCPVAIWPPLQQYQGAILSQTKDTALSIQNFIEFPEFGIKLTTADRPALDCLYDPINNKHCPYFKLEDVVRYAHDNTKSYEEIATKSGAIFEIKINWNCSTGLFSGIFSCHPGFSFWRRDNENSLWAFWEFDKTNPERRVMTYGWRIKFQVTVSGIAKRFSWYKLLTSLFAYGSLIGISISLFLIIVKWCTSEEQLNKDNGIFCDIPIYCIRRRNRPDNPDDPNEQNSAGDYWIRVGVHENYFKNT